MTSFSPKIEIINHFDKLINKVDIEFEESLENYNEKQYIGELNYIKKIDKIGYWQRCKFYIVFDDIHKSKQHKVLDLWPGSTKAIDYLKQVRMNSIEELRKAQEDTLDFYKLNSSRFKSQLTNYTNIDQLKSELFAEKFYFQVHFAQSKIKLSPFSLFTFVTDFYMSPSDIDSLEKLIKDDKEPFCMRVFDEKLVLIGLLYNLFVQNVTSDFPKHFIRVSKQEVLNIQSIDFKYDFIGVNLTNSSIDLSKLDFLYLNGAEYKSRLESLEVNIEGLSSLEYIFLGIQTAEAYSFSIRNLHSLKCFCLKISMIDQHILTTFIDKLPNIEELFLHGNFSYFNLDHLVNLKVFGLIGKLNDDFNFELLKNLSYQLQKLSINLSNDYDVAEKLLEGHQFSNLIELDIFKTNFRILRKKFIDRFPALLRLEIYNCNLEMIEDGAFSNIKQLTHLDLGSNFLKTLEKQTFSQLTNIEQINLRNNRLEIIEKDIFLNMKNLRALDLSHNNFLQLDYETINCLKKLERFDFFVYVN